MATGFMEQDAAPAVFDDDGVTSGGAFFRAKHHDGFLASFFGDGLVI